MTGIDWTGGGPAVLEAAKKAVESATSGAAAAVGEDPAAFAKALPSLVEQARSLGHGYLVLQPPDLYDYATVGAAVTVPDDANMAVVRVADGHVTFGGPAPGLASTGMSAELTGLRFEAGRHGQRDGALPEVR